MSRFFIGSNPFVWLLLHDPLRDFYCIFLSFPAPPVGVNAFYNPGTNGIGWLCIIAANSEGGGGGVG